MIPLMKLNNVMSSLESLEKMYLMSMYASGLPLVKTYAVAEREPQELELMMMTVSDLKVTSMSIIYSDDKAPTICEIQLAT